MAHVNLTHVTKPSFGVKRHRPKTTKFNELPNAKEESSSPQATPQAPLSAAPLSEARTPINVSSSPQATTVLPQSNNEFGLKVAAGAALAAGVSALIFTNWEKIERYLKWGKLANEAAADSVLLLETKMDRAIALCDSQQVDADELKRAISAAHDEARNLVAINQQLRDRLRVALSVNHSKFF
jgi:cell division septum initiation protein DivIVA